MGVFQSLKRLSTALHRAADAGQPRDIFALEPLEQRILLSTDPMLSPAGVMAPEDEPESHHVETIPKDEQAEKVELTLDVADLDAQDRVKVEPDQTLKGSGEYDIRLDNAGTLELEVGGTAAGTEFDELDVAERATLSGDLDLSFINDYEPSAGDTFELMRYGEVEGGFDRINGLHDQGFADTLLRGKPWQLDEKSYDFFASVYGLTGSALRNRLTHLWVSVDVKTGRVVLANQHHDLLHND